MKHIFARSCTVKFGGPLGTGSGLVTVVVPATLHVQPHTRRPVVHAVVDLNEAVYRALAMFGLGRNLPMATTTVVLDGWEAASGISEYRVERDGSATIWCSVAKKRDAVRLANLLDL